MTDGFSDYLVFVDESGDHGLDTIDPGYPVFVLAFCVINKADYVGKIVPALQHFKLKHFGHDNVILHERDIRKDVGGFAFLKTKEKKAAFLNELTQIVADVPFSLICSVIRKEALKQKYSNPDNPYHIALGFGLERVHYCLQGWGAGAAKTHVIVERRGRREDVELELEFRRVCDGGNYHGEKLPLEIVFADKKANLPGLQLADLVARPVGMSILRPEQPNRAFEVLAGKFYTNQKGNRLGWGLKCFP
ncbi:MAG: DUF3800 domain-containing protein [Gammaproteobacteria bacterium]|nr:DUF3800 domain-containing protein [Gammaproteobacteria bacterium]